MFFEYLTHVIHSIEQILDYLNEGIFSFIKCSLL